jgi:hypothetical protein
MDEAAEVTRKGSGMVEQVDQLDQQLIDWATDLLPGIEVSLGPPGEPKTGRGVGMYLMDLLQAPPPSTVKRSPLQLSLRYLITSWAENPKDAHKMLGELALGAMGNSNFQMELEPIPVALWTAFGIPPRPAFVLRMSLRKERSEVSAKPVLSPMIVKSAPISSFHGLLLGRPGDLPLADAAIEVPALRLLTHSDRKGRFIFPTVPSEVPLDMRIRAKGKEFRLKIDGSHALADEPFVISLDVLEG